MTSRAVPFIVLVAAIGLSSAVGATARAEEGNPALAAAMKNATAALRRRATSTASACRAPI
jgi:hypothetical protein